MRGSDFAATLPDGPSEARERALFDAVRRRDIAPIEWSRIRTNHKGKTAYFGVSSDALRIGDATDSFRATTGHRNAQLIADELHAFLPTPKLSDEIWAQADVRIAPQPHLSWTGSCVRFAVDGKTCLERGDGSMAMTHRMLQQSKIVDNIVGGRKGLLSDVGKDWVNSRVHQGPKGNKCGRGNGKCAINYGWHRKSGLPYNAATPAGGTIYQPPATAHDTSHADYSQTIRLIQPLVKLCDDATGDCRFIHIQKLASDPEYSALLSHEGPLTLRHPDVSGYCPLYGVCPAPGTPMDTELKSDFAARFRHVIDVETEEGAAPCPEFDCGDRPPVQPQPRIAQASVAPRSGAAAFLSFAAGATVGYLALRAFLPRL